MYHHYNFQHALYQNMMFTSLIIYSIEPKVPDVTAEVNFRPLSVPECSLPLLLKDYNFFFLSLLSAWSIFPNQETISPSLSNSDPTRSLRISGDYHWKLFFLIQSISVKINIVSLPIILWDGEAPRYSMQSFHFKLLKFLTRFTAWKILIKGYLRNMS